MRALAGPRAMLSGLTVVFGNQRERETVSCGSAREVVRGPAGFAAAPVPIRDATLYDLASLTKLFTAVAALQLILRGRLRMADRLGDIDRRFERLRDTTVYDALTYQAVLRSPERIDKQPTAGDARRQVFLVSREPREPERLYSDMNALVLKYVLETVSGTRLIDYLREHVFGPAGMTSAYAGVPETRLNDCVDYNYEHRIVGGEYHVEDRVSPGTPHDPKARALREDENDLAGHAGLFCTAADMARFAQALLRGDLLPMDTVREMGVNRTGRTDRSGVRRQYLGFLCFSKCPVQRVSEVPSWMGARAIAISGYTGNHIAIDPNLGAFDLFLGNRCHNRVSKIIPESDEKAYGLSARGEGMVKWPDGREVPSSCRYIHRKDDMLHEPVLEALRMRGWLPKGA